MEINKELLKGSTELLVLTVLESKSIYGYEIIKELKKGTNNVFKLQEGTIYPILHKLEEKKYISSYWDEIDGKRRKYYSITKEGKKQLSHKKEEWKIFTSSVNEIVGGVLFEY